MHYVGATSDVVRANAINRIELFCRKRFQTIDAGERMYNTYLYEFIYMCVCVFARTRRNDAGKRFELYETFRNSSGISEKCILKNKKKSFYRSRRNCRRSYVNKKHAADKAARGRRRGSTVIRNNRLLSVRLFITSKRIGDERASRRPRVMEYLIVLAVSRAM